MYQTGDLVRWNDEGQLDFLGRLDDQVKINGHRVELGEIENRLLTDPSIALAAVAAHRSNDGTVTLVGYVVARDGAKPDPEELHASLSAHLPGYMVPRRIMILDSLPLTPNGKLDRKALPVPERATRMLYSQPVTPSEKKLAMLWQEILGVECVGLHDNFFELGGDSLTAARLSAVFPSHFGLELPLGSVFEAPTIAELAERIDQMSNESADPLGSVLPLRRGKSGEMRPLFCIHPMAGLSFSYSALLRHLDPDIPVYGLQSRGLSDGEGLRRESALELRARFSHHQPQLRVVWLRSEMEQDLLFVSSHRICDGMSMLTIVKEVLRSLHRDEKVTPYAPISPDDIIGDYRPSHPWMRGVCAQLCNSILRLIPGSKKDPGNHEYDLEWTAGEEMTDALRRRCKSEQVSIHAALTVALNRALLDVLGKRKIPAWIESPMDARRGRLAVLRGDMLFFGGGSLNLRASRNSGQDFWEQARAVSRDLRAKIEQELRSIPGRYHFFGLLRPLSDAKIRTMVRISDALGVNGSWNRFALSNLGDVVIAELDAPFRVIDLRLYVHSFNIRLLGLVCYLLNGKMRFYYVGDEKCMNRGLADALQREMMALLQQQTSDWAREHDETLAGAHSLAG